MIGKLIKLKAPIHLCDLSYTNIVRNLRSGDILCIVNSELRRTSLWNNKEELYTLICKYGIFKSTFNPYDEIIA
jgi:hypothetical protein